MSNKVALITGATSGIGAASALEFAKRGYDLVLCGRRQDRLLEMSQRIKNMGLANEVLAHVCDVNKRESLDDLMSAVRKRFLSVDVVYANAGFGVSGLVEKLSIDDFKRQFDTNVYGVLNTLYATLEDLKKSRGSFAITGSGYSYFSAPRLAPYCMSKFAIKALADTLYWELAPHKIAVTLICPGIIESEIRKIDNQGNLREKAKDPAPAFLIMKADKAAVQIVNAIEKRKREKIITFHAKVAVLFNRLFPSLFSWISGFAQANYRK